MNEFPSSKLIILVFIIGFSHLNFFFCCSLNDEGIGLLKFKERVTKDPFGVLSSWKDENGETKYCSWFGIECVDGHVVSLDLSNLCLEGTLAPELRYLLHIRSFILRNNSFSGAIPEEIRELKELKLLDLAYNNFTGPFSPECGHNIPILFLDNNGPPFDIYPELMLSEAQVDENLLTCPMQSRPSTSRHNGWGKDAVPQRMLQQLRDNTLSSPPTVQRGGGVAEDPSKGDQQLQPLQDPVSPPPKNFGPDDLPLLIPPPPHVASSPTPNGLSPPPAPKKTPIPTPNDLSPSPAPKKTPIPNPNVLSPPASKKTPAQNNTMPIVGGVMAGFVGLVLVIGAIYLWRSKKITKVTAGMSGQLRSAFITGIPNLKRAELETACEDFSNVIGSSSIGTLYKGILSTGTEIAVISSPVKSAKDWSQHLEMQFRKKIENLSAVKHKNFVNLIGYCEEKNPFARMMVFEYAPNGTLFEHLHVREAEHLDWGIRLRVTMGMAYCLEHMHQLVPPITHPNFNSSAVNLSEDYAAKISDFCLWNQLVAAQMQATQPSNLDPSSATPESNVYSFGLVLMEIVTGRVTLSLENSSLEDWTLDYLRGERPLQEWVDPMLRKFNPGQLEKISEVIRKCLELDPQKRPTLRDVAMRLREITGIDRDKAAPRLSPVWWEELEVLSVS